MSKQTSTNGIDDIWARSSAYEIRDGYIRPATGAAIEKYRPWVDFQPLVGREAHKRPYLELLKLLSGITETMGPHGRTVSDDDKKLILDWCRAHGLLGILLHRLETAVLPQRVVSDSSTGLRRPSSARFVRIPTGWLRSDPIRFGGRRPRPGAYMRSLYKFEMSLEPISAYGRFIPDIARSKQWSKLPSPATDAFWRLYGEPLDSFLEVAGRLRRAIEKAGSGTPQRIAEGVEDLRILTAPVRAALFQNDQGQITMGWACHSLLASYAMMASLDLAQSQVLRCVRPDCGAYFVSKVFGAQYCSSSCRSVVQMRRSRAKA